ncbi:hypothetical protein [Streptomyces sp. NPDC012888]|uniref:hypothetical protein n=1 Tax=Streptomyces sp. NPDC012888 TaxID=3364855 RepID=UPI0036CC08AD
MTTALAVRVLLSSAGETNDALIVGDVHPADRGGESRRGILIPCGTGPVPAPVPVPPGRYLVSATLPSGLVLTEEAVAVEGRATPVDFDLTDSPYGTHAWQYLMGNIEPERVYHAPGAVPLARSVASRSMVAAAAGPDGTLRGTGADLSALATWIGDADPASLSYASLLALTADPAGPEAAAARIARGEPHPLPRPDARGETVTPLYRFGPHGPVREPVRPAVGQRQFLLVRATGSVRLVTLPLPWGDAEAEVLVNLRQSPTGSAVAVAVRDPALGPALAYMAQGALDTAARLCPDPAPLVASAHPEPLAAAAAGYVLAGTAHPGRGADPPPWLDALADGFPWLPDGAVLRAVHRLRRNPPDLRPAREELIAAFDRGVPVYTLGLAWLAEGFSAFPEDPACARRLDAVHRLSWLADMREPFLILDLRQGGAT